MKVKSVLIAILTLFSFASYAQDVKNNNEDSEIAVTDFSVKTKNLDELVNFDWSILKDIFRENEAEQKISLELAYENKVGIKKSKTTINNFKIKVSGKMKDLDSLIGNLQKSLEKFQENYVESSRK